MFRVSEQVLNMLVSIYKRCIFVVSSLFLFFVTALEADKIFAQSTYEKRDRVVGASGDPNIPKIGLMEVIRQVEANHPKLNGAEIERRIAEAKFLEKQGAFDPTINVSTELLRYNSTSSVGKPVVAFQNQGSVEWATRSGMKVFAGSRLNFGRVKSPLSATGETGEYFAGVAMPLLRDRGTNEKSIAERRASVGVDVAENAIVATRLEIIRNAGDSYWEWAAAKQRLEINQNLLEIATERAKQIGSRVLNGDLPPIDSQEANLEVQRRMGGIVKAQRDVQKAQLKLGLYLWNRNGEPDELTLATQNPVRLSVPNQLPEFVITEGLQRALRNSPDLRRLEYDRYQTELDLRLASNNRKTRVDLYAAPSRDTGFNNAAGFTFKFGANVEIPLRTRTADGQIAAASLKLDKIVVEENLRRQTIRTEITDAAQAVNAAHDSYLLAVEELTLARRLEQAERTRFAVGDSTLFLVNQRERATAEAQIKVIDIQAAYEQALIAFKVFTLEF